MQNIPSHVPKELVFPFNMYNDARTKGDIHEGLATLFRDAPDLFYTPENGGHWVATRYELMNEIVKDHERFSSREVRVPRVEGSYIAIPLNLDPPEHTFFRLILMHHFSPSAIRRLETRIRHWAKFLIGEIAGKGKCDFADTVGSLFPVSIFMELMGLPLERLREYRALVVEYFGDISAERRVELEKLIGGEMRQVIEARQIERRDDLISKLLDEEVDGKKMTLKELEDLANLMFQAGMDTVANFATFFFRYMGYRPELQRLLHENPDRIPDIVEEGFRMFGVVNNGRLVKHDTTLGGVQLRANDMVITMLSMGGLDDRVNADPHRFDIERKNRTHMLFSQGPHLCIGHQLARMEMQIFLDEWVKVMPEFRIADGYVAHFREGSVMGLGHLPIEWTPMAKSV